MLGPQDPSASQGLQAPGDPKASLVLLAMMEYQVRDRA